MSFGKSSNQAQQTAQSTMSQSLDPQIKGDLLGNYQRTLGLANAPYQPFTGETVAGLNATQQGAGQGILNIANSGIGQGALNTAMGSAGGVAGYQPQQFQGQNYAASQGTANNINRGSIGNLSVSPISSAQIQHYMSPYTQNVVDTTNTQLGRANQIAQVGDNQSATAQGAFGGARSGVANALTNEAYMRTLAGTDAGLYQSGYGQALGAAQQDQGLGLQAQQANQNIDYGVAGQNAAAQNAFGLANLNARNQAGQFNAGQNQAAMAANQQAGLQGANTRLQGANSLAGMSSQQIAQALGLQGAAMGVGNQQQQTQQSQDTANLAAYARQQNWPLQLQQLLNQSLGLAGNPVLGQSQQSSQGTSSGSSFNFAAPSLASLGSFGGGGGGINPFAPGG